MIKLYSDPDIIYRYPDSRIYAYIQEIDRLVVSSARNACILSNLNRQWPKQNQWYNSALLYLTAPDRGIPDFLYAHYGSAVEDLVNLQIRSIQPLPDGIRTILQYTHGSARPDIVILKDREEYAWLDITSQKSKGHIKNRPGYLNASRSVTAELLYDDLIPSNIRMTAHGGVGSRIKIHHAERISSIGERQLERHMAKCTDQALFRLSQGYRKSLSKSDVSRSFVNAFGLPGTPPCIHQRIKSILKKYMDSYTGLYRNTASEIYRQFYSDTPQSWAKAQEMIIESYQNSG